MSHLREVIVQGGPSGLNQQITANGHRLLADEPLELGGTDTGPNPYDLLLAALGACTSMTVRLYADRKGWKLTGIRVHLGYDKIHANDCKTCETKTGYLDRIEREIQFQGELSPEQQAQLLEISERCPVARTLKSEIVIETRLANS